MQLAKLLNLVRTLAPEHLAEKWDKVGLHLGDPARDVCRVLLCIDFTPAVLREAIGWRSELIIAYHPPIFSPLQRLTEDQWKQKLLVEAVRRHLAIYCPHTALDAAPGGMNDWWCDGLGRGVRRAIMPHLEATASGGLHKIVTFVPQEAVERLRAAMAAAGAGCIGAYGDCSFMSQGVGTFRGKAGTNPTVGRPGRLEQVPEVRLEMVCPAEVSQAVQRALLQAHPYEEPAFDVYPLLPPLRREVPAGAGVMEDALGGLPGFLGTGVTAAVGAGRVVFLDRPVTMKTLLDRIRGRLGSGGLQVYAAQGQAKRSIQRVAVCVGAAGALLTAAKAAAEGRLDVFFTGEMRHHDVLDAVQGGVTVVLAGHAQTERPYLPVYRDRLAGLTAGQVLWRVSRADG